MEPAKEQAKKALNTLPEDATWEDIMYKLYVTEQIALGTKDLNEGRTVSHEEVKKRFGIERRHCIGLRNPFETSQTFTPLLLATPRFMQTIS